MVNEQNNPLSAPAPIGKEEGSPAQIFKAGVTNSDDATHCRSCDYSNLTVDFGPKCPECGSQDLEQWTFGQSLPVDESENLLRRAAAAFPGPYAVHILGDRTRWFMTGGGSNVLRKLLSEYELNELTPEAAQLHRATDTYLATAANALPGLLARIAKAEALAAAPAAGASPVGGVAPMLSDFHLAAYGYEGEAVDDSRPAPSLLGGGAAAESEGALLIAAERQRQIDKEGYTAAHDDEHEQVGQLALAAVAYAIPAIEPRKGLVAEDLAHFRQHFWPWAAGYFRPTPADRVRELTKAGALIAAEIDRLKRAAPTQVAIGGSSHE